MGALRAVWDHHHYCYYQYEVEDGVLPIPVQHMPFRGCVCVHTSKERLAKTVLLVCCCCRRSVNTWRWTHTWAHAVFSSTPIRAKQIGHLLLLLLLQVTPQSLVMDPYVGTGSILVAAAARGAATFGGDIDHR